jgi:hypothetical protein
VLQEIGRVVHHLHDASGEHVRVESFDARVEREFVQAGGAADDQTDEAVRALRLDREGGDLLLNRPASGLKVTEFVVENGRRPLSAEKWSKHPDNVHFTDRYTT